MQLKALLSDDDGVSPVIGVILMVAITVILAAVIATFVLGLGDNLSNTAPQMTFDSSVESGTLTITVTGGESVHVDALSVTESSASMHHGGDSEMSAGDTITMSTPSDTVRVIWESPESGQTATVYTWNP